MTVDGEKSILPVLSLQGLSLTDLIKLRDEIERVTRARYEKELALVFTDVVGSTSYFEQHGDAAGRALLQRHLDILSELVSVYGGRIVDTAGDGAFVVFEDLVAAVMAVSDIQLRTAADNGGRSAAHQLGVRSGIHWGPVLTDGVIVTGDDVHLAARITSTAGAGDIHVSEATFNGLPPAYRMRCRSLPPRSLKGFSEPVPLMALEWRDPKLFPTCYRIVETGVERDLPPNPVIRIGRLAEHEGRSANEIVLEHPDPDTSRRISRWHCELVRRHDGLFVRAVSRAATVVDGQALVPGTLVQVHRNSEIQLSNALTIRLLSSDEDGFGATMMR